MSDAHFTFRAATLADAAELSSLYRASALGLATPYYTAEQIRAWASWPDDVTEFEGQLRRGIVLVSMVGERIVAFAQLEPTDHIALLFTHPQFARQGHASALLARLEEIARSQHVAKLSTTASLLSRPLFAKRGFALVETEHSRFKGVAFERYKMQKSLNASA